MITKDAFKNAMLRECDICVHLFGKLGPEAWDYRPAEKQRSTAELLRYLAICGIAGATCMKEQDWKRFAGFAEKTKEMPPEAFPDAMARQKADLETLFATLDEDTLRTRPAPLPGGGELPLGEALLNGPFKWLTSYKLQLFLYAKANGAEIGTANAWRGVDWKG